MELKGHCTNQMMEVELGLQTILKGLLLGFVHCASLLHLDATVDSWNQEGDARADC